MDHASLCPLTSAGASGDRQGPADFSIHSARFAWDGLYLYGAVEVMDDIFEEVVPAVNCYANGMQIMFEVSTSPARSPDILSLPGDGWARPSSWPDHGGGHR